MYVTYQNSYSTLECADQGQLSERESLKDTDLSFSA